MIHKSNFTYRVHFEDDRVTLYHYIFDFQTQSKNVLKNLTVKVCFFILQTDEGNKSEGQRLNLNKH